MAKRRPETQLTQNNWNDEMEKDEVGQFQKADDSEMKNRVFRVAKRRIQRSSDETDAGGESSAKPVSVFSGFSLISNKSSLTGATETAPSKPTFSFGSGFSSQPFGSTTVGSTFGGTSAATTAKANDNNKSSEFVVKLKELNDAVLKCIKGHIDSGKACILTPIFNDYEKYVKELEDKDKNAVSSSPAKANNSTATAASGAGATTTPAAQFSFSAAKSPAESTGTSVNAASTVTAAPTQSLFSFKPTTTFGSSSTGFSFSSGGFQAPKPANNDNKDMADTNGGDANADDESDEPPKVEFKPVVEEESIYSKRCKVFVKEDGNYKDRGTGTLYLKKVKDDKVQLIVRADTNLGNILLNFLLTSAAPPKPLKNNVMIVCVPTPDADATKPKSVLIRVKTEDDATELIQEIEQYQ